MKFHYYLMSMALAATAMVGFTACDDDDKSADPVYVVGPGETTGSVGFTDSNVRVKIGTETRINIPVSGSSAGIQAYSLDPEIATVVDVDGVPMIEGLKNGSAKIMVSDAEGNYEVLNVTVYTTEEMTLNYSNLVVKPLEGKTVAVTEVGVAAGNGGYTATSDDSNVTVYIDEESGELAINARGQEDPYTATVTITDCTDLSADLTVTVSPSDLIVKIGSATRVALPFTGEYTAEVISDGTAELYTDASGKKYIEGLANGTAVVTAQQGDTYYHYTYTVYTTDVLTLSDTNFEMTTPLGLSSSNSECHVVLGNGGYSVTSNNSKVRASINSAGVITITATSSKEEYTAVLTVKDSFNLTATINVTVKYTMDAFTASDIEAIKAMDEEIYAQLQGQSYNVPTYWTYYKNYGYNYGEWITGTADGVNTYGWWYKSTWSDYGGIKIEIPDTAQLNEEVSGKIYFKRSSGSYYPLVTKEGTAKIIYEDASKVAVIFWNVDLENECINRGYVVSPK